ncbi:MAG: DUF3021 domain-containing protein [Lachnospiraceae bacterium]|nr:DUF3021 domain-containing protein [Lachnospiraceae bacterium]
MKDLIRKTIIRALLGAVIGIGISISLHVFFNGYADAYEVVIQLVGSAILGIVNMGAMSIYDIESWGLLRSTVTHFVLSLSSFLLANSLLGWFDKKVMLIVIVAFVLIYFMIWLFQYLIWKREITKMNENLSRMNKIKEEGD